MFAIEYGSRPLFIERQHSYAQSYLGQGEVVDMLYFVT